VPFPPSFIKPGLQRVSHRVSNKFQDAFGKDANLCKHKFTRQISLFCFRVKPYVSNWMDETVPISVFLHYIREFFIRRTQLL